MHLLEIRVFQLELSPVRLAESRSGALGSRSTTSELCVCVYFRADAFVFYYMSIVLACLLVFRFECSGLGSVSPLPLTMLTA